MRSRSFTLWMSVLLAASVFSISAADRTHHINYGDTLWDLSIRYYSTPFHWPDILAANPSIEAVELLQPGSVIVIPDIYHLTISSELYSDAYSSIYTLSGTSTGPLLSRLTLETAGMVSMNPPDPVGWIVETNSEEQEMVDEIIAYPGDLITLDIGTDQGVQQGTIYKILDIGEAVHHPDTGHLIGNAVRVAGICSVTGATDQSCIAMVEHAYLPVVVGQYVIPYQPMSPVTVSGTDVIDSIDAWVLAFRDKDLSRAYSYDVIYIDRGSQDGLRAGDIFNMYNYGTFVQSPSGRTVRTPDLPVSQLIVLDVTAGTAAAMVYTCESSDLVDIGDRIELVSKQI